MPVVAGSDKTTVSVATGHQSFHPVYQGLGGLDNISRRAHNQGILPTAFLPIPKGISSLMMLIMLDPNIFTVPKEIQDTKAYQTFTRQLYHACLACIFEPLRPGMTIPEIVQCPDRHYRRAIFGIGPYIADYPEQVLLACVVSNWCPKCTARPENLDGDEDAVLRTHKAAAFLIENFDPGIIWSDVGVRSDVQVRPNISMKTKCLCQIISLSLSTSPEQIFTSCFRQTFFIKSSRGRSRIILSSGSTTGLFWSMGRRAHLG